MHRTDKYSQHSSIIWSVWLNGSVFIYKLRGCGFEFRCCHLNSDIMFVLSKDFSDIQATIECRFTVKECRFTLKRVRDMIIIYSHHFHILAY